MTTDKYQAACVEYQEARQEVLRLKKAIGDALSDCLSKQVDDWEKAHPGKEAWELPGALKQVDHLKEAYEITRDPEEYFRPYYENHDGDPAKYLADLCPHCLKAHQLIQDRKEARKRFGIAKRRISTLGSHAKKGGAA